MGPHFLINWYSQLSWLSFCEPKRGQPIYIAPASGFSWVMQKWSIKIPNVRLVCEAWQHELRSHSRHMTIYYSPSYGYSSQDQRMCMIQLDSQWAWLGCMHHSNILIVFWCHGFVRFQNCSLLWVLTNAKKLKNDFEVVTMLRNEFKPCGIFFLNGISHSQKGMQHCHVTWSCDHATNHSINLISDNNERVGCPYLLWQTILLLSCSLV